MHRPADPHPVVTAVKVKFEELSRKRNAQCGWVGMVGWSDLSPLLEVLEQRMLHKPISTMAQGLSAETREPWGVPRTVQPLAGMSFRLYLFSAS